MKPYPHQEKSINEIFEKFESCQRVLYQLPTGGGKTVVFSFIAKRFIEWSGKKVLMLCHRDELIKQTLGSMNKIGVTCEAVTARTKKLHHNSQAYVGMIETVYNRLKKNPYFLKDVGLVISDECHILIFDKVFNYFPFAKILGCTATPCVLKRLNFFKCKHCKTSYNEGQECCGDMTEAWSKPFVMNMIYEDIVVGASIQELIETGKLVQEISYVKNYANINNLKTDAEGEFTTESLDKAYNSDDAVFNVLLNYNELCRGKKTMIFNSSSKSNLIIYEKFKEAGINVRMYDSVNKKESGNRNELVEWFKRERDAVLLNVNVFTAGFDVTDVEAIILNRATMSLALFLQMVGRGGRSTDIIYKDNFIVIDGGGNIDRHQEWSDPTRDWKKIFFDGLSKEKAKSENIEDVQTCEGCGYLMPKTLDKCPECGYEVLPKPKKPKELSNEVLEPIREIPPPNGEKIYKYTVSKEENINFAFKILINQIVDMFRYYKVDVQTYERSLETGEFDKKIKKMVQKCYFVLLSKKDIAGNNNRTLKYITDKIKTKLDKYYGTNVVLSE